MSDSWVISQKEELRSDFLKLVLYGEWNVVLEMVYIPSILYVSSAGFEAWPQKQDLAVCYDGKDDFAWWDLMS